MRRALDRVRNVQFGGDGGPLDRRVSVARSGGPVPGLLLTFLGRLASDCGPELERVVAVRAIRGAQPEVFTEPADWESLAAADRAVPTAGVWESHFAAWAAPAMEAAQAAAAGAFAAMADAFAIEHGRDLDVERRELDRWFDLRVGETCGTGAGPVQANLFVAEGALPDWRRLVEPTERLAAYAIDPGAPARTRSEAQTLLSLYEARRADLERRLCLHEARVEPIGLLMLTPEDGTPGARRGA